MYVKQSQIMDKKQKEKTPTRRRRSINGIEMQNAEDILTLEEGSVATREIVDAEYVVSTENSLETRIEVRDVLPNDYESPGDDDGNNIAVTLRSRDPLGLEEPRNLHITGKFRQQK